MLRTHTCGELNKTHANQKVTLCGWVAGRRDHGKLIFIDIRDRYGDTQVAIGLLGWWVARVQASHSDQLETI